MNMSTSRQTDVSAETREVVAAIDADGDDREFVIADITTDGVWIAADVDDAATLEHWR